MQHCWFTVPCHLQKDAVYQISYTSNLVKERPVLSGICILIRIFLPNCPFPDYIIRLGLNVALTHQNRSYSRISRDSINTCHIHQTSREETPDTIVSQHDLHHHSRSRKAIQMSFWVTLVLGIRI